MEKVPIQSYYKKTLAFLYDNEGEVKISSHLLMHKIKSDKECINALKNAGYYYEAIKHFRTALKLAPSSHAVPVIFAEIADAFNNLGKYYNAFNELDKIDTFEIINKNKKTA